MTDTASAAPSLMPCPFCGAGDTQIHVNKGTWTGQGFGEPVSVEVRHWCLQDMGQPSRGIVRVGRDEASAIAAWNRRAQPTPPAVVEPPELSPDFTDTARAALLWVLWHHQGGSSPVGQPIRFALGMGQHDRLNEHQLAEAKRWERLHPANPAVFPRGPEPLTLEAINAMAREHPAEDLCGWSYRMGIADAERHHGIKGGQHGAE